MLPINKYKNLFLIVFSIFLYFLFAYSLERAEFNSICITWLFLFGCFYLLIKNNQISFSNLVGISILFRLIFLFATPNLSQDFYRFIWDGRLILEGFNPYLSLPETFIERGNLIISEAKELYNGMGNLNGSHYTNYPPLNQLNFLIAALFSSKSIFGSIVILRLQIIFADIGIIYFGRKLLDKLNINAKNIFWYALNPFVIIEMTGNLHFESVMLFFLVWSLYQFYQKKWIIGSILLGCSISIKLIPLLFLPLFFDSFRTTSNKKTNHFLQFILFSCIAISVTLVLFIPFLSSELITNYTNSIGLWFDNFEFNASFYYILREIGYLFRGYNEISIIGKIGPILTVLLIGVFLFKKKQKDFIQLISSMMFILSFYYFTSTTIHPWYISTILILSIFTKYKFPLIWSFLIIISYQAYANTPWKENFYYVAIEYILLYICLFYELYKNLYKKSVF